MGKLVRLMAFKWSFLIVLWSFSVTAEEFRLAAAANLSYVLPNIIQQFEKETTHKVKLSLGSTRSLTYQIMRGAPFEVFLSADRVAVEKLKKSGLIKQPPIIYALGLLCFFQPQYSAITLPNLATTINQGQLKRLAIANPETAPYGLAARQFLKTHQLWQVVKPQLVFAENAAQAGQFALSGSVDAALLPCSITNTPLFRTKGYSTILSKQDYSVLEQAMVLLNDNNRAASDFFKFMRSESVKKLLLANGYQLP